MNAAKEARVARERILETASDLFSSQGYRATGVNEVIDRSGVAKATASAVTSGAILGVGDGNGCSS